MTNTILFYFILFYFVYTRIFFNDLVCINKIKGYFNLYSTQSLLLMANKCNLLVVNGQVQFLCLYKFFKWEGPLWGLRGSYVLS